MFAQCWRALSDNFYDSKHHGTNWNTVREKYLPLVEHTATREDLLRARQHDARRTERVAPGHQRPDADARTSGRPTSG